MKNICITLIIPCVIALYTFYTMKYDGNSSGNEERWLSRSVTTAIKGLAAIIIIFVHIPPVYGNPLQHFIGRFAYIGVTLFFAFSGYGCCYGLAHKKDYLNHFWKKRIIALAIPSLIINLFFYILNIVLHVYVSVVYIIAFNSYIYTMMFVYLVFWIVYKSEKILQKELFITIILLLCSCFTQLTDIVFPVGWAVERIGFIIGIYLFKYKEELYFYILNNQKKLSISSLISSFLFGILYLKFKEVVFFGDFLLRIILGISVIVLIFSIIITVKIENKLTVFLGNISFELFLAHTLLIKIFENLDVRMKSGNFILIVFAVSIIVSTLCNKLSQKIIRGIERGKL